MPLRQPLLVDYRCLVEQERIRNVTVVGPSEIIDQIDTSDVIAQINMLDYNVAAGDQIMTATLFLPNYDNVWCMGTHKVYCSITEIVEEAAEQTEDEAIEAGADVNE